MTNDMTIDDYLKQGGVVSSPANLPPRYRAELLRLMASFIDSELAASAGFAEAINHSPGIRQRINAAKIVLEKARHAGAVLELMGEFGADTERYAGSHPWNARIHREDDIGRSRADGRDMRLSVFYYPFEGWNDAVIMNVLMGIASSIQLEELSKISYAPLAETFREIIPEENAHTELGIVELHHIMKDKSGSDSLQKSIKYWLPRIEATFGQIESDRFERLQSYGLKHRTNRDMLDQFKKNTGDFLARLAIANN